MPLVKAETVDVVMVGAMMESYKLRLLSDHDPRWSACLPHRFQCEAKVSSARGAEAFPVLFEYGRQGPKFRSLHRASRRPASPRMNSSNPDSNQELS